jgi:predicted protein tyrosine phosphatase
MFAMPKAIDQDKLDQAVLALLSLGRHDGFRTWKGFDWEVMGRLHQKGDISDPAGKAKSNQLRSPTAEHVFSAWPWIEVASAGLDPTCKEPVTPELLGWADLIFVMERHHRNKLLKHFRGSRGAPSLRLAILNCKSYPPCDYARALSAQR